MGNKLNIGSIIHTYRGVKIVLDPHYESVTEYTIINVGRIEGEENNIGVDPHIKGLIKENLRIFYTGTYMTKERARWLIDIEIDNLGIN